MMPLLHYDKTLPNYYAHIWCHYELQYARGCCIPFHFSRVSPGWILHSVIRITRFVSLSPPPGPSLTWRRCDCPSTQQVVDLALNSASYHTYLIIYLCVDDILHVFSTSCSSTISIYVPTVTSTIVYGAVMIPSWCQYINLAILILLSIHFKSANLLWIQWLWMCVPICSTSFRTKFKNPLLLLCPCCSQL